MDATLSPKPKIKNLIPVLIGLLPCQATASFRRFSKDGKLMAEIVHENNKVKPVLNEYPKSGKTKKGYPKYWRI